MQIIHLTYQKVFRPLLIAFFILSLNFFPIMAQIYEDLPTDLQRAYNMMDEQGDYNGAFNLILRLAERGDPAAMHGLYIISEDRKDIVSPADGIEWLKRAADEGYYMSQERLGWLYLIGKSQNGNILEKDMHSASYYLMQAANQGDYWSIVLILKYSNELPNLSSSYLRKIEEKLKVMVYQNQSAEAAEGYADLLLNGEGVARNEKEAEALYRGILSGNFSTPDPYYSREHAIYNSSVGLAEIISDSTNIRDLREARELLYSVSSEGLCKSHTFVEEDGFEGFKCGALIEAEKLDLRIQELYCAVGFEEKTTTDVFALFDCNKSQAIAHFSKWRRQRAKFDVDKIDVTDGRLIVIDDIPNAEYENSFRKINQEFNWDDWRALATSSSNAGSVVCIMDLSDASEITEGDQLVVRAKLEELVGSSILLNCKI